MSPTFTGLLALDAPPSMGSLEVEGEAGHRGSLEFISRQGLWPDRHL